MIFCSVKCRFNALDSSILSFSATKSAFLLRKTLLSTSFLSALQIYLARLLAGIPLSSKKTGSLFEPIIAIKSKIVPIATNTAIATTAAIATSPKILNC